MRKKVLAVFLASIVISGCATTGEPDPVDKALDATHEKEMQILKNGEKKQKKVDKIIWDAM